MKRAIVLFLVVLAVTVPAGLAWPGRPTPPPPTPPQPIGAPPPAWIETQAKSAWLFYGGYCWQTSCIDMIPPESRPGLPTFAVRIGMIVRVHLGFAASRATVSIARRSVRAELTAGRRVLSWPAGRAGVLTVSARAATGSASYVARLRVR